MPIKKKMCHQPQSKCGSQAVDRSETRLSVLELKMAQGGEDDARVISSKFSNATLSYQCLRVRAAWSAAM